MSLESKTPIEVDQSKLIELIDPWAEKLTDLVHGLREKIVCSEGKIPYARELALFIFEEEEQTLKKELLELKDTEQLDRFKKICNGWRKLIEQNFNVEVTPAQKTVCGIDDYSLMLRVRVQGRESLGLMPDPIPKPLASISNYFPIKLLSR